MTYDGTVEDFDWRVHTTLLGTVSRIGQFVRGDCAKCPQKDVLVYDTFDDPELLCAGCSRVRAMDSPRTEMCDRCGGENVWRDPLTGKNEFFCARCHGKNGTVFQNRWGDKARVGRVLAKEPKAVCAANGYGTDCKGEIKWRGAYKKQLCNKHAGVKGVGPNG